MTILITAFLARQRTRYTHYYFYIRDEVLGPIASAYTLTPQSYTLTQLRYDLRKLKAHDLLQRYGHRYTYCLTEKGVRVALMFVLFHQRICGPLANSLFHRKPTHSHTPATPLQAAYQKADASI